MSYKINKRSGKINCNGHYLGVYRDGYITFNEEMEYCAEDLKEILKLIS